MIESPSKYLLEDATNMEAIDIIDSCYAAFNEGVNDSFIVSIAASNTMLTLQEHLERVRESLMTMYATVLGYLNNYIFNSAKLADKYRGLIIEKYRTLENPILFHTYQYSGLKDKNYPILMKSSGTITNGIRALQTIFVEQETSSGVAAEVTDRMIVEFGRGVVDGDVDTSNLDASVEQIVRGHIQGRKLVKRLSKDDLNAFIDEIIAYKPMKDSINATKKIMLQDYTMLKNLMTTEMQSAEASAMGIEDMRNPDAAMLRRADYQRFASINLSLAKMFNSFIRIYSKAFDTKLAILNEKITENKDIITKLMVETSVFAAINPHNPARYKRPQKFEPKLKA